MWLWSLWIAGPLDGRVSGRQTSIHLPVDLHQRVRKYAFDQEVTLSSVMVDAIEAWLDARECPPK
jgi:predicted transcriptional regulator